MKRNLRQPASTRPQTPKARVGLQLLSILILGSALGLAFNLANPLGIRWENTETVGGPPLPSPSSGRAADRQTGPTPPVPAPSTPPPAIGSAPPAPAGPVGVGPATVLSNEVATASGASFNAPSPTSWAEAKSLLKENKIVLVDARSRPVFDAGHIPGAVCLPEESPGADIEAFRDRHGTNTHVVIYCSSTSCSLSFRLAYKLAKDYGFARTQYMTGGYFEYQREVGLADTNTPPAVSAVATNTARPTRPTAGGAALVQPVTPAPGSVSQTNPEPMSWGKVEEWLLQRKAVLVDTRSEEAFKAGHVPGAVSLPSGSPPEKLAAFRQEHGTHRPVIVYGDAAGSMRAFLTGRQLMRETGFTSVRFVTEGYKEWQAKQENPAPQ